MVDRCSQIKQPTTTNGGYQPICGDHLFITLRKQSLLRLFLVYVAQHVLHFESFATTNSNVELYSQESVIDVGVVLFCNVHTKLADEAKEMHEDYSRNVELY